MLRSCPPINYHSPWKLPILPGKISHPNGGSSMSMLTIGISRAPDVRHVMTMKKMTQLLRSWNEVFETALEMGTSLSNVLLICCLLGNEVFKLNFGRFCSNTKRWDEFNRMSYHLRNIGDDRENFVSSDDRNNGTHDKLNFPVSTRSLQLMRWTCHKNPYVTQTLNVNKPQKELESHPFVFDPFH